VEGEGKGSTFSLVYATSLLQHQAEFGLNSALGGVSPLVVFWCLVGLD